MSDSQQAHLHRASSLVQKGGSGDVYWRIAVERKLKEMPDHVVHQALAHAAQITMPEEHILAIGEGITPAGYIQDRLSSSVTSRNCLRSGAISSPSLLEMPGFSPASTSAWRTQRRTSVSANWYSLDTPATVLPGSWQRATISCLNSGLNDRQWRLIIASDIDIPTSFPGTCPT
jgi:hypothetical protein